MNGKVDESLRALVDIRLAAAKSGNKQVVTAWIDTAFNGGLAIPPPQIEELRLKQASMTRATLADGSSAEMETFTCYVEWFGGVYRTQVVAKDGELPLLGTLLLANHRLTIDYTAKTLVLD